jgi:hypothetical protein
MPQCAQYPDCGGEGESAVKGIARLKHTQKADKKKNAGKYAPDGCACGLDQKFCVSLVFPMNPPKHQGPGKGHDTDKACQGGVFFGHACGKKDNQEAQTYFDNSLQHKSSVWEKKERKA